MIAVIGTQFGDEGKGKIIDYIHRMHPSYLTVRFNGGANAGHTVVDDTHRVHKTHIIPSSAYSSRDSSDCAIAGGMVIDVFQLIEEIEQVKRYNSKVNFWIDWRAGVLTKCHIAEDILREKNLGKEKIGTTGRGNGPAYADRARRSILIIGDLLRGCDHINEMLMKSEIYSRLDNYSKIALSLSLADAGVRLSKLANICDVGSHITTSCGEKVLFEGAHGTMLDIIHGTYPFVTSSGCTASNIGCSVGIDPRRIKTIIGVVKSYSTRIGAGAFPTEIKEDNLVELIRKTGKEFGTTTGRPRRIGWLDIPMLKYAIRLNGIDTLALTLTDIYPEIGMKEIKVCTSYDIPDKTYYASDFSNIRMYRNNEKEYTPNYEILEGWDKITDSKNLPTNLLKYIHFIEDKVDRPISIVSYGRKAEDTLWRGEPLL